MLYEVITNSCYRNIKPALVLNGYPESGQALSGDPDHTWIFIVLPALRETEMETGWRPIPA